MLNILLEKKIESLGYAYSLALFCLYKDEEYSEYLFRLDCHLDLYPHSFQTPVTLSEFQLLSKLLK